MSWWQRMIKRGCLAFSLLLYSVSIQAEDLPLALKEVLTNLPIQRESLSLWVATDKHPQPLVAYQHRVSRTPASLVKLITTGVGLKLLGGDYRWDTAFYTSGKIHHGTLYGDLYIQGFGNPYLIQERLIDMIAIIRQQGITRITGQVVLDDTYFARFTETPNAFDGRGSQPYNALPNALSINFRTVEMVFTVKQGRSYITTDPVLPQTVIDNRLSLNDHQSCRGRGFSPKISVDDLSSSKVVVDGSLSMYCQGRRITQVLGSAGEVFYANFRKFWLKSGGQLTGQWRYGQIKKDLRLLYRADSKPLSEQIQAMNKLSNNLMSRQLFLTLGAEQLRPPATLQKSRAVVMETLQQMGVSTRLLWLDNGAGLSREARLTAEQMGRFLHAMRHQKEWGLFEKSLAVAGVDGTMRWRLRDTPLAGRVMAKTGSLDGVRTMAGYLTAQSGEIYSFVIMIEDPAVKSARVLIDAILQWIYTQ